MKLRAQAAVEYLMILAVVIIIALVVVGVLGGFPSLTAGISEKESAAYWTTADVGIVRNVISATAATKAKFVLRNNKNFAIEVTSVKVGSNTADALTGQTLQPGETTDALVDVGTVDCGNQGDSYTYNIVVTYKDSTYLTDYTFTGAKQLVGVCQA